MAKHDLVYPIRKAEQARLTRKFGSMWHSWRKIAENTLSERCYCCYQDAVVRIEVNIWGTVIQYDVCATHREYEGRNCDGVPAREFDPIAMGC